MKFQIHQQELSQLLRQIMPAVEKNPFHEVMSNILLEIADNTMTLTTTNNEIELKTSCEIDADDISTTVPAHKLSKIVSALPDDSIINFDIDGSDLKVSSGRSRFKLATLPTEEFPIIDPLTEPASITLPQEVLKMCIDSTSFAMADKDVRYYLNGMLFEINSGQLKTVATDGHRLALRSAPIEGKESKSVILPRKTVLLLSKLLTEGDLVLNLTYFHLQAQIGNLQLTSKLIEGKFPDYEAIIPANRPNTATVEVAELKSALSRSLILANEQYQGVAANFVKGGIELRANNPRHESATDEVPVDYDGDEIEIGFKCGYMLDTLSATDSETVDIHLRDGNSSMLIKPDADTDYVVMPMKL